jgi:hypothetical protein
MNREHLLLTGAGLLGAILVLSRRRAAPDLTPLPTGEVEQIIIEEARRQGVNPRIALLFASLESSFKNVTGDTSWYARKRSDGRTNWERWVRDNDQYNDNPYRYQKELWVSYGPFQLLAPFNLSYYNRNANPRVLGQVPVNAKVAIAKIKRLGEKYNWDVAKMRLAYRCGTAEGCSASARAKTLARLTERAASYGVAV